MAFRIEAALASRLPRDGAGRHRGFAPGQDIDLSDPQVHRAVCGTGFAGPEHDGTWTQEAAARLRIRLADDSGGPLAIWFAGQPFVTERHTQSLDLRCDGVAMGRVVLGWEQAGMQIFRFIRPETGRGDPWLQIELRFGVSRSPAQEGLSGDTRPLGLKLARLAVTDAAAAAPPLFDGPVLAFGGDGGAAAVPTPPEPDAEDRLVHAKLDRIAADLRATLEAADQARRSAGRVAAVVDRMIGAAPDSGGG